MLHTINSLKVTIQLLGTRIRVRNTPSILQQVARAQLNLERIGGDIITVKYLLDDEGFRGATDTEICTHSCFSIAEVVSLEQKSRNRY